MSVRDAIGRVEALLPGEPAYDGQPDVRRQAIVAAGNGWYPLVAAFGMRRVG